MRRTVTALGVLLSATLASWGGDLPPAYPPPPTGPAVVAPPAGYSWSGFYIGVYSGDTFSTISGPVNAVQDNGWVWGGIVGANYQMGNAVLSVEADYGATFNGSSLGATGIESVGNVRGRIGWAFDRLTCSPRPVVRSPTFVSPAFSATAPPRGTPDGPPVPASSTRCGGAHSPGSSISTRVTARRPSTSRPRSR